MSDKAERTTRKVGAWIPHDLYDNLSNLGYFVRSGETGTNQTDTIIEGLQLLLDKISGGKSSPESSTSGNKEETSGDSREIGELRAQVGELGARNEELERYNLTLKEELTQAHKDKDDIKTMFNNHVLQVQTLINQKAIESEKEKKKWWKRWI